METAINRNIRIRKKNIILIFWNLIVHPHLLLIIIIIHNLKFTSLNKTNVSLNLYNFEIFKSYS